MWHIYTIFFYGDPEVAKTLQDSTTVSASEDVVNLTHDTCFLQRDFRELRTDSFCTTVRLIQPFFQNSCLEPTEPVTLSGIQP